MLNPNRRPLSVNPSTFIVQPSGWRDARDRSEPALPANGGLQAPRPTRLRASLILIAVLLALMSIGGTGCSKQARKARHLARAEQYFAGGEYDKAAIEYQNVLRVEPTNPVVLLRMARIFCEQGSPLRALQTLQDFGLKPEDPVLRCRLAEFHLSIQDRASARREVLSILNQSATNSDAILLLPATVSTPAEMAESTAFLEQLAQRQPDSAIIALARANLLLRQKQAAPAEQLIQQALRLAPDLPQAHLDMAQIHLMRTNQAAADQSFAAAVKAAPVRSPIRIAYARSKISLGKPEEARAVLTDIIAKAPDYLPASLLLARMELQARKPDAALPLTDRVLARDPFNLEARQIRSQAQLAKGQTDKAAREWEDFDQKLQPNPLVRLQLARMLVANRESRQAITTLNDVIQLSSNRLDAVALEAHLLKARIEMDADPAAAVEPLQQLISQTNLLEARLLLADAYRRLGRFPEATVILNDMAKEAPNNPTLFFLLGVVLREQNRLAEARQAFQLTLELAPGNVMALYQIVDVDIATTNHAAALRLLAAESARQTNTPAALKFLQARVYAAQAQWTQAETALKQVLEQEPTFSSAYTLLASIYLTNNNLAAAAKELESLTAQRTNDVPSLMLLGTLRDRMNEPARAAEVYEQLLTAAPQFVPALNNLAYLYSERLNQLDKAAELARRARQLAPEDPAVADTLGWVLHKQGDNQGALPLLKEAAEKLASDPEVQFHVGVTSYMLGLAEPAKVALQKALASPASFAGKDEAQSYLARLTGAAPGTAGETVAQLEKIVKTQPKDLTARMRLAALYEQGGNPERAASEYEEVLRQNPRTAQAALRLGQLNAGPLQNRAKALEFARKARDLAPNDPETAALLGRLVYQTGDHAQAYSLLQPAARQLARRPEVQFDLAWAAYCVGRVREADQAMRQVLQIEPGFKQAEAARGFLAMTALQLNPQTLAQSEAQIQQQLKTDPNHAPALMCQALLWRAKGDAKAAAPLLEKLLATFPKFVPAARELGLIHAADPAQAQKAYDLLTQAREAYADDAELARALALLSYQRKDYRYASSLLQASLRTRPNDAEAMYYLGMALCQVKETASGKEQLQKAVAAGLKDPLLSEARKVLAAGNAP